MKVLGLNAFHGDSSAALVIGGEVVAAAEEERFRRIKHWAGFPSQAISWCLRSQGLSLQDVDAVAINQDSTANFSRKLLYNLTNVPSPGLVIEKLRTRKHRASALQTFLAEFPGDDFSGDFIKVEHHLAHLASAYYPSGFDQAWCVSVDGFGDFASGAWSFAKDGQLDVSGRVLFPHSLGAFYQAMTQYLGFPHYGDEYKVMGLAPYGKPTYLEALRELISLREDGSYRLNLDYFCHHKENVMYEWDGLSPGIGTMYSAKLESLLGPARRKDEELLQKHRDLAHSVQAIYEEAFFHLLNTLHRKQPTENLVLSGGCAMNSVANGKVRRNSSFRKVYIQAAAGDAGGAIGAALVATRREVGRKITPMRHAYLGPSFGSAEIRMQLADIELDTSITVKEFQDESRLCDEVARYISEGKVVGWFHGAMEWGPRALGHRSILGDPRREGMKEVLNLKIKRRESFRPFAPSVLREEVGHWFEEDDDVPFMMKVLQIQEAKRSEIPAVTHVDGSGRLQTVTERDNGRYYRLIKAFHGLTGVPMVLNTSFNENEPIVCTPRQALDCFQRTKMDVLVLEDVVLSRT